MNLKIKKIIQKNESLKKSLINNIMVKDELEKNIKESTSGRDIAVYVLNLNEITGEIVSLTREISRNESYISGNLTNNSKINIKSNLLKEDISVTKNDKSIKTMSSGEYHRMCIEEIKRMKKEGTYVPLRKVKSRKSQSVRTVSGGLPSLGKKR